VLGRPKAEELAKPQVEGGAVPRFSAFTGTLLSFIGFISAHLFMLQNMIQGRTLPPSSLPLG